MNSASAAYFQRPSLWTQLTQRLLGDWPLVSQTLPLSQKAFAALFQPRPSFADYLPFVGYDAEAGLFQLDDGVSVSAVFRLAAADLDGRSPERLAEFNHQIDHALQLLPNEDELFPVVVQIYLESREPANIADTLAAATPEPDTEPGPGSADSPATS